MSFVKSDSGVGGVLMAVQEGKSLVNVWAWQKVCIKHALGHS